VRRALTAVRVPGSRADRDQPLLRPAVQVTLDTMLGLVVAALLVLG
jgi:hypothetical protein